MSYRIVRCYQNRNIPKRTIARGLTLEEAQAHCSNPETSSSTCTSAVGKRRTKRCGPWFDSYALMSPWFDSYALMSPLHTLRVSVARVAQAAGIEPYKVGLPLNASYEQIARAAETQERGWNSLCAHACEVLDLQRREIHDLRQALAKARGKA